MKKANKIVITGIGPLTSGGSGNDEVWEAVLNRKTGLVQKEYTVDGDTLGRFYVHKIKNFNIEKYGINKIALNEVKAWKMGDEIEDFYYFLAVIKMALNDAKLEIRDSNKYLTGLVIAHENMGMDHFYWKMIHELSFTDKSVSDKPNTKKEFLERFYNKFHRTGYELQTFMPLHHIAKIFDVHGFSLFLNNACASGLYALEVAKDAIISEKCKQMIIAAVDCPSIFKQMWFRDVNCLAKDGQIKPFAPDRDGFTIGDGGTAFVMETYENAKKRKARIYAEYLGGSFVSEGWKVTYPDISNDLYKNMIIEAIKLSKLKPSDIDLIVPHGVATNVTDKYEAKAIREVFDKKQPLVTALKPYIGHTLGSTALLETAIMLLSLKNGKIPPTLNCENTDNKLGIEVLRDIKSADNIKITIKTACGFAGFNGACLFKEV